MDLVKNKMNIKPRNQVGLRWLGIKNCTKFIGLPVLMGGTGRLVTNTQATQRFDQSGGPT